jgi:hypothetical protein
MVTLEVSAEGDEVDGRRLALVGKLQVPQHLLDIVKAGVDGSDV